MEPQVGPAAPPLSRPADPALSRLALPPLSREGGHSFKSPGAPSIKSEGGPGFKSEDTGALPAGGQLWLPSLPRLPTDRTGCWPARRPRRPQGQAAARGGGSLRINQKGTSCTESQMQQWRPQLAHCSFSLRALASCKHPVGQASRHPPEACGRTVHPVPRPHQLVAHSCSDILWQETRACLVITVTLNPAIAVCEKLLT